MITLITGTPGTGKTAYAVAELLQTSGRNIYVDGIPDLLVEHVPCPPVSEWVTHLDDESGATSFQWNFPPNSIIVIDEAQRSFRPRPAGSKVPDYVAALETHRHAGLDFWFITQHPTLLDVNVRRLCGRHIHVRNTPIGRKLHESTQVFDPESKSERDTAVTRPYKLPKQAFSRYKSAEIHTKTAKRLPLSAYFALLAFVAFLVVGYFVSQKIKSRTTQEDPVVTVEKSASVAPPPPTESKAPIDPADLLQEFTPRVPGRPETAPAFDALRQVRNMPVVVGCYATATNCRCVNQQGLDAGLDSFQCRKWLANPPFEAYRDMTIPEIKKDEVKPTEANDKPSRPPAVQPVIETQQIPPDRMPIVPQSSPWRFKG